jgi:hypothetical protein
MIVMVEFQSCNSSISFVDVAKVRTKLINEIESYQHPDEFKKTLDPKIYTWKISGKIWDGHVGKWRPPYVFYNIEIMDYSYLGFQGKLKVDFFNNRLMETTFYPSYFDKFVEKLKKKEGLKLDKNIDNKEFYKMLPYTRILINKNKDQMYIRWTDIRLKEERDLWIHKHA